MRRVSKLLLPVFVCAFAALYGQAQTARSVRVDFKETTLKNGLRVITVEDRSAPVISLSITYNVGSRNERKGRTGFAHLFEHMMFKGTKRMPSEFVDRLTEDVGGENNAYTANDVTVYHEVVPSNHLERLLWAEAERLSALTINRTNFMTERDVVKEEFRQSVLSQPYGEFGEFIQKQSFVEHPYRRPTIGNIAELDAANFDDVVAFHSTFYRPDNATLIVVGDFDSGSLQRWVDQYFGPIKKPEGAIPRVGVKEPARTKEKTIREYDEKVPFPAIAVTFLAPPVTSDQRAAWQIIETVLGQGDSSRLYRSLVYEKRLAQSVEFYSDLRESVGLPTAQVVLSSGVKVEAARAALLGEFERISREKISERELKRAKNQLLSQKLHGRETAAGKAEAIGEAAVLLGDANLVNSELDEIQKVTAEEVLAAARECFTDANRLVIEYLPATMKPVAKSKK
jgi:zinc protease